MKTKNSFRTWKSGKTWLYSSLVLGTLLLSSGISANQIKVLADTTGTQGSQMTSTSEITAGLQANIYLMYYVLMEQRVMKQQSKFMPLILQERQTQVKRLLQKWYKLI